MGNVDEKPAVANQIAAATPRLDLSYIDRKLAGLCTRRGCKLKALDDGQLCKKHRTAARRATKRWDAKMRKQRRAAGQCASCGAKSKAYRCLTCRTKRRARIATGTDNGLDKYAERMDRIRARTFVEADGRTRYRGQERRGRQTVADLDEQDIDLAILYLTKCRGALRYARRPEAADVPRIQRREAEHAAIGELAMGLRFGFDICVRNGYPVPEPVEDDDVQPFAKLKALAGKAKTNR